MILERRRVTVIAAPVDGCGAQDHAEHLGRGSATPAPRSTSARAAIMQHHLGEITAPSHRALAPARRPDPARGRHLRSGRDAKRFCGAEAPGFVNGILAAALREMGENGAYR